MLSDEPASQEIMSTSRAFLVVALLTITFGSSTVAASSQPQQQHEHSMSGVSQEEHNEQVNKQGDTAMGFSHAKATHHFRLTATGGFIEVQTKDPKDSTSGEQIRIHLQHVSKLFKAGDFSAPEMTHGRVPPGVPAMTRLKGDIENDLPDWCWGSVHGVPVVMRVLRVTITSLISLALKLQESPRFSLPRTKMRPRQMYDAYSGWNRKSAPTPWLGTAGQIRTHVLCC